MEEGKGRSKSCQGTGDSPAPSLQVGQRKSSLLYRTSLPREGKCMLWESPREPQKCGVSGAAEKGTVMADPGQKSMIKTVNN